MPSNFMTQLQHDKPKITPLLTSALLPQQLADVMHLSQAPTGRTCILISHSNMLIIHGRASLQAHGSKLSSQQRAQFSAFLAEKLLEHSL